MSYVIDVYRKDIKPTRNVFEFAAFVSFFPHLVAGPIMRPTTLLPQIQSPRKFNLDQIYQGCYLIFWGLTKKVVVADNLAPIVNDLFGRWQTIDGGLALLAIYAFAFQIYCDFSGYTDAARGIARGPSSWRSTSTCPISPPAPRISGTDGTSASRSGCRIICTSRWAVAGAGRS